MMLKNLLGRKGYSPIRVFSSPCPSSRITTKDKVTSKETVKEQEIQWTTIDEKHTTQLSKLGYKSSNMYSIK